MSNNDIQRAGELARAATRSNNAGFPQWDTKSQTADSQASSDQARIAGSIRQDVDPISRLTDIAKAAGGIGNRFAVAMGASGGGNSEALRESLQEANTRAKEKATAPVAGRVEAENAIGNLGNQLAETAGAFSVGNSGFLRRAIEPASRPLLPSQQLAADKYPAAAAPLLTAEDLGRVVRAVRKKRGLSQQRFADLAGVGRRFLSELEHGKETLELGKALKVARMAGIDIEMNSK